MSKLTCRVCDGPVLHGNLTCSQACAKNWKERSDANVTAMLAAGFVQDEWAPNIYRKGGISITLEHVNHVGLEKVISHHATVAAIRAHGLGVELSAEAGGAGTRELAAAGAEPAAHGASGQGAR